jgi:hypothetical protein
MNCQDMARILDEQEVDGLLAEEQSGVQVHLNTCRECARDWQIHAQLAGVAIPAVPAALRAQFTPQMVAASRNGGHRRNRLVVIGVLIALAAAAATLLVQKDEPVPPVVAIKESAQTEPSVTQAQSEERTSPAKPVSDADPRAKEEMKAWTSRVTEWLVARDDADALLAAAILVVFVEDDDMKKILSPLLERAAAKAPDSARIHASAVRLCLQTQYCDATPYQRELRRIAPDNALGWVVTTSRARRADGQEVLRRALAEMARAKTYDLYENAGFLAIISLIREARVPPPRFDGSRPAFSPDKFAYDAFYRALQLHHYAIQEFCKSATDDKVLAECHQVGAAMRAGDTIHTNLAGISISGYGLPADSAEARSLAQQERRIRWMGSRQAEIIRTENPDYPARFPLRLQGILGDHPRMMDVYRTVLEEHGIPTEPPADWKCSDCGKG